MANFHSPRPDSLSKAQSSTTIEVEEKTCSGCNKNCSNSCFIREKPTCFKEVLDLMRRNIL